MDPLSLMSSSGGSDVYVAGTYKFVTSDVATITLTGASGTATITINGTAATATFATDLETTAQNFVRLNYDAYKLLGVLLSTTGDTIVCTMTSQTAKVTATVVNLTTDLAGTVVKTRSGGSNVATFTLTGTGHTGATTLITVNGISKMATYDTSIEVTSTAFVAANAAAYLLAGLTLTGTTTIIFTANAGTTITEASLQPLHNGTLTGTFVITDNRLPHPVCAAIVHETAVVTSVKYLNNNGFVVTIPKKFPGISLEANTMIIFEYPVVEIVLASGELVLYYVK